MISNQKNMLFVLVSLISFGPLLGSAPSVEMDKKNTREAQTAAAIIAADSKKDKESSERSRQKKILFDGIRNEGIADSFSAKELIQQDWDEALGVIRECMAAKLAQASDKSKVDISVLLQVRQYAMKFKEAVAVKSVKAIIEIFKAIPKQMDDMFKNAVKLLAFSGQAASDSNPLLEAIYSGSKSEAEKLCKKKALVDKPNSYYKITPLMVACYMKDPELVRLLINAGVEVDRKDLDGNTALHYLFLWNAQGQALQLVPEINYVKIIHLLLAQSPSIIDVQNDQGITASMLASLSPIHEKPLLSLIEKGANTQLMDNRGNTALMLLENAQKCSDYNGWFPYNFKNFPQISTNKISHLTNAQKIFQDISLRSKVIEERFATYQKKEQEKLETELKQKEADKAQEFIRLQEERVQNEQRKKNKKKEKAKALKQPVKIQPKGKNSKETPLAYFYALQDEYAQRNSLDAAALEALKNKYYALNQTLKQEGYKGIERRASFENYYQLRQLLKTKK